MAAIGNSPTQQAFTPAIDYFSGNGSTTAFTLSRPVASVAQVQVTIDNVAQNPSSAYTVSANTITFTSAPLSGTNNIYVYYTSPITQVIAPSQGTVNTTSLAGGTVTTTADATLNGLTVGKGGGAVSTNTAVGASALVANTSGSVNTAIGYNALDANTSGLQNTAVGNMAVSSITTGNNNTGIGHRALESSTGNDNSAVGSAALQSNTTGASNVAIGQAALLANTTASNNTAVGYQAGYSNTTNVNFAGFGYRAGYSSTADDNTCIGMEAGYSTTGGQNTFIGNGAGYSITTGARNTILGRYGGNGGGLDIRTLSNRIVLADGAGNPRLYADNNGAWQSTSAIGNGTLYPAYFCRAWVFFNCSNAAISGSGNVSSVTRISAGSYRVNFTTALPDANYAGVSGFARINATPQFVNFGFDRTTTYDRVETFLNGNFDDLSNLSIAYFR
jgi:hypothetical protein